jgi:hypothetical protein
MHKVVRAGLCLAMLIQLPACGGSIDFWPETAQDCNSDSGQSGYCFGLQKWGGACLSSKGEAISKGTVLDLQMAPPIVGWSARWDPGTQPFACKQWASTASRAYVNFNIFPGLQGKADKIFGADLVWFPSSEPLGKVCYSALFEATGPWKSFDTPGEFITDWPEHTKVASKHSVGVTEIIRRWAKGDQQYFGFFFTSLREDLPHGFTNQCETTLSSLRLEVKLGS